MIVQEREKLFQQEVCDKVKQVLIKTIADSFAEWPPPAADFKLLAEVYFMEPAPQYVSVHVSSFEKVTSTSSSLIDMLNLTMRS